MANIFEELRKDHETQRDLLQKIVETAGQSEERTKLWAELKHQLQNHADAEERYFYNPLLKEQISQKHARHSIAEHHEIDEQIEDIESIDMTEGAWLQSMKKLADLVSHHLAEEEHEIFQVAGKALSENQKEELAASYRGSMIEKFKHN